MSASAIGKPLGQPSRMTPTAGPWLSPNVAILKRDPNWLDIRGKVLLPRAIAKVDVLAGRVLSRCGRQGGAGRRDHPGVGYMLSPSGLVQRRHAEDVTSPPCH